MSRSDDALPAPFGRQRSHSDSDLLSSNGIDGDGDDDSGAPGTLDDDLARPLSTQPRHAASTLDLPSLGRPSTSPALGSRSQNGIRVVARFRPENAQEIASNEPNVASISHDFKSVTIEAGHGPQGFSFHHIFPPYTTQAELYEYAGSPVVDDVLSGYNAAIIAYGQTGSGKTFTMLGPDDPQRPGNPLVPELRGVIPRLLEELFARIESAPLSQVFQVKASFVEVYMENVVDLLTIDRFNLKIMQGSNGLWVTNATEIPVRSKYEVLSVLRQGTAHRVTGRTNANVESSRSHAIVVLTVVQRDQEKSLTKTSQLCLVDLAGSEKVSKTGATGQRLNEAKLINTSLLSLGNVIQALATRAKYVPYRDSKLTRILQNSFGGNSRTTLIINCSPSKYNAQETLSTLRFGDRTRLISNRATANAHRTVEELERLLDKANADIAQQKNFITVLLEDNKRLQEIIVRETGQSVRSLAAPPASGRPPTAASVASPTIQPPAGIAHGAVSANSGADVSVACSVTSDKYNRTVTETHFFCPLTRRIMREPVVALDGFTYEKQAVEDWFKKHSTSPLGHNVPSKMLIPNWNLRAQIRAKFPDLLLPNVAFFNVLPAEIIEHVFSFLPAAALCRAARVCKLWRLVASDEDLWRNRFLIDFPEPAVPPPSYRAQYVSTHTTTVASQSQARAAISSYGLKLVAPSQVKTTS